MLARARQSGTISLALRSITDANRAANRPEEQVQKRDNVNVVRYGSPVKLRHRSDRKDVRNEVWGSKPAIRTGAFGAVMLSAMAALTLSPLLPVAAAEFRQRPRDDVGHRPGSSRCGFSRLASASPSSSTCRAT